MATGCEVCKDDGCMRCMHAKAAEALRLRRLFDDAGQGEHNVLALIDHYQDVAAADEARAHHAEAELARLTTLRPISELTEEDGVVLVWIRANDGDDRMIPYAVAERGSTPTYSRYAWSPLPKVKP